MNTFWQDLLKSFGGPAALLLALAYLIKTLMSLWLERTNKNFEVTLQLSAQQQIETFKAKLQNDAMIEIERLKNSLQVAALEHQVRFSKLHEQRVDLIRQLSKEVQEVPSVVAGYVIHNIRDSNSCAQATSRAVAFCSLIDVNRFLLPESALAPLTHLATKLRSIVISISVFWTYFPEPTFVRPEHRQAQQKEAMAAVTFLEDEVPVLKGKIEAELRRVLEGETMLVANRGDAVTQPPSSA